MGLGTCTQFRSHANTCIFYILTDVDLYDLESDIKMDWYPKEKINYVKRKLKGDNPAYITR